MRRRKATKDELRALSVKMDKPEKKVVCPTCGNDVTYIENAHGRAAMCERCSIMTAERGL